jgi:hypothetical protein
MSPSLKEAAIGPNLQDGVDEEPVAHRLGSEDLEGTAAVCFLSKQRKANNLLIRQLQYEEEQGLGTLKRGYALAVRAIRGGSRPRWSSISWPWLTT